MANDSILEIVKVISKQGHSNFSGEYVIGILERLLRFKPLSAIEDNEGEWEEASDNAFQYKRCYTVFKEPDGKIYNISGKVFSDDGGKTFFMSKDSRVEITMPYEVQLTPERIILDNNENKDGGNLK